MNDTNTLNTLLPQIITAGATLIGVIVTAIFAVIQNRISHKRELAKLEQDYRLKALSLDTQAKKDVCTETYGKMLKAIQNLQKLSGLAFKIVAEMKENKTPYPADFDEKFDELNKVYSELFGQLATLEIFASEILLWHYMTYLRFFYIITQKGSERITPMAFFPSANYIELWNALQTCRNNFLEQCKVELYISQSEKPEIYCVYTSGKSEMFARGYYLRQKNGDVVLLSGSITKKVLEKDYYKDIDNYIMTNNQYFKTDKEAEAYLVGTDAKYETKLITF